MKTGFTAKDVTLDKRERLFQGYFAIDRYHLRHRRFAGGEPLAVTREIFERGHAVTVVLYDPVLDELVLIEQFRPGVYAALGAPHIPEDVSPWLIETVAGIIDEGETPEGVAIRETREEAGLEVSDLIPALHYFATPGGSSESIFVLCGRVDAGAADGNHGLAHEGEDIRVFRVGCEAAFQAMDDGIICNSMTLVALGWFRVHHRKIRQRYLEGDGKA